MSAGTLSPPRPPACLTKSCLSRGIKGGTVIAEDVLTLEEHENRLRDPDGYRPDHCNCGGDKLHGHCFRERCLRPADQEHAPIFVDVRLYRCADCGAVFTVLPAFIARHLWRQWQTVEAVTERKARAPRTTLRRWLARLKSDASQLLQIFAASAKGSVTEALLRARPTVRRDFIAVVAPFLADAAVALAPLAAWIHRLEAGVRLM